MIRHHTGDVSSFGKVPTDNIQPTIVLGEEDIKQAQENLLTSLANNQSGKRFELSTVTSSISSIYY